MGSRGAPRPRVKPRLIKDGEMTAALGWNAVRRWADGMSNIRRGKMKRYKLQIESMSTEMFEKCFHTMHLPDPIGIEDPNGEWVKWEDHEAYVQRWILFREAKLEKTIREQQSEIKRLKDDVILHGCPNCARQHEARIRELEGLRDEEIQNCKECYDRHKGEIRRLDDERLRAMQDMEAYKTINEGLQDKIQRSEKEVCAQIDTAHKAGYFKGQNSEKLKSRSGSPVECNCEYELERRSCFFSQESSSWICPAHGYKKR